ncbi:TPA: PASTA domain-containing protein, partial [Methanosarcinaceae archaeon]|nr:PASTA domain-containing protein [Methanosarcinaceae archaeon]
MEEIVELKNNLENFNRIGAIDSGSYAIIMNNLEGLETKLGSEGDSSSNNQESLEELLDEKLLMEQENEALTGQVEKLSRDLRRVEYELESMEKVVLEHKESSGRLLSEKLLLGQENEALAGQVSNLSRDLRRVENELESMRKVASGHKERFEGLLADKLLLNQEKGFLESRVSNLSKDLNRLEIEFESIEKVALGHKESSLNLLKEKLLLEQEKLLLEQENVSLIAQAAKLTQENSEFRSRLLVLQRARPALTPVNLVSTFRTSLEEINLALKETPSGTKYGVSNMNVSLKTNLAFEGEELRFQMPKADDIIPPENLSTIEFSLGAVPDKPASSSSSSSSSSAYRGVPDLVGLSKKEAESIMLKAGFKPGEILEKNSSIPQDMVISQLPASGGLAERGSAVDLIIAKFLPSKVPDLLGLELDIAKTVIELCGLKLGGVREKLSEGKPGLIFAQSLKPGSEVELNSKIILVVSVSPENGASETVLPEGLEAAPADAATRVPIENPSEVSNVPAKVSTETQVASSPSKPAPKMKPPIIQRPGFFKSSKADAKNVPFILGLTFENASEVLNAEGIKVGKISELVSPISAGTVLHQGPKAGCIANPLIPVDLVVSRERPRLKPPIIQRPGALKFPQKAVRKVPPVVDMPYEKAVSALEQEGIKVGKISEIFSLISPGTVLHQGPKAGCIANPLIPVDLVVSGERPRLKPPIIQRPGFLKSRKEDSITVPPVLGLPSGEAVEVLKQEGIKVGNISTIISRASPGRVLHQSLKAGCIANPLIPVDLVVSGERPRLKPPIIQRPGAPNCPKTDVMKIPRVIGVSFEKAVEVLKQDCIKVGKVSEIFSGITPGTVLHQGPKAGRIANPLIPVDLVVSKAVVFEVKTVPRVTGLSFEEAVAIMGREGVNIGKVSRIASRASPGVVLFQGPKSGTIANPIIPVDLVVSREIIPEVKRVPCVIDMPFAKAIETLKKEGINIGRISEIASRVSPGMVLFQGPKSGCIANPVIPVDLVVSKAPKIEVKKVPRVLGLPFKEAVDVLEREGVDIGRISEIASRVSPGIVLFQGPGAGCIANPLIPVDLVVSKEVVPE